MHALQEEPSHVKPLSHSKEVEHFCSIKFERILISGRSWQISKYEVDGLKSTQYFPFSHGLTWPGLPIIKILNNPLLLLVFLFEFEIFLI